MGRSMTLPPVKQLLLLLITIPCIYKINATNTDSLLSSSIKNNEQDCNLNTPTWPLHPQKLTTPAGYPLYYLLPPKTKTPPQGVLIYLHGCYHSGHDFFLMPEERIIVQHALCSNLAVVSLESSDQNWGCWREADAALFWDADDYDNNQYNIDYDDYDNYHFGDDAITKWMEYVDLPKNLPRYGMGVSSGASILLSGFMSGDILKLDAVASYIIYPGQVDYNNMEEDLPPPTIFVHMPKDGATADHVANYRRKMVQNEIGVKEFMVHSKPFDVARCVSKIPELGGEEKCLKLITHLIDNYAHLLDPDTFEVKVGHEDKGWLKAWNEIKTELVGANGSIDSFKDVYYTSKMGREEKDGQLALIPELTFKSTPWIWACVLEEIGVCYARHKMTVEYIDEVFQFFREHGGGGMDGEKDTSIGGEL